MSTITNREKILQAASILMEKQGYHATGINEIIKKSGAPKGSVYYYFPDGKEQIASEAVIQAGKFFSARIQTGKEEQSSSAQVIRDFLYKVADHMEKTNFYTGSTLTMIAMESATQSKRVNKACREAYERLIGSFKDILVDGGTEKAAATGIAEMIVAAVEGAIVLSRTFHTADPLRRLADHIHQVVGPIDAKFKNTDHPPG